MEPVEVTTEPVSEDMEYKVEFIKLTLVPALLDPIRP